MKKLVIDCSTKDLTQDIAELKYVISETPEDERTELGKKLFSLEQDHERHLNRASISDMMPEEIARHTEQSQPKPPEPTETEICLRAIEDKLQITASDREAALTSLMGLQEAEDGESG